MYTERYLPKRYKQDSRHRRLRTRNKRIITIAVLVILLAAGGYLVYTWLNGEMSAPIVIPASTPPAVSGTAPAASDTAPPTAPASGSSQPADTTSAEDSAPPTDTSGVSAPPSIT